MLLFRSTQLSYMDWLLLFEVEKNQYEAFFFFQFIQIGQKNVFKGQNLNENFVNLRDTPPLHSLAKVWSKFVQKHFSNVAIFGILQIWFLSNRGEVTGRVEWLKFREMFGSNQNKLAWADPQIT